MQITVRHENGNILRVLDRQLLVALTDQLGDFSLFMSDIFFADIGDHWARQEMAIMLKRALIPLGKQMTLTTEDVHSILQQFTDVADVSDWAQVELAWMIDEGLIQGRRNDRLVPIDHATRAEAATLLYRLNAKRWQENVITRLQL